MQERTSDFIEFAEYLFSSKKDEKIYISLETETDTQKTDLFEFCLNLLIFGYQKNKTLEEIKKYFNKIDIELEYNFENVKLYSPYEITKDFKLVKNYSSDVLFAMYQIEDKYIYFSFKY